MSSDKMSTLLSSLLLLLGVTSVWAIEAVAMLDIPAEDKSLVVGGRCECVNHIQLVRLQRIVDITVMLPDWFCSKTQIILTLEQSKEVCLNPDSYLGQKLLDCWKSHGKDTEKIKKCMRKRRTTQ
ncbi:hypothetical protein GJAV_G00242980 [Gymnothorax javanicus]|nr:hypothetical protein GJAV_G00242980 [Gymnothorax javanicus]